MLYGLEATGKSAVLNSVLTTLRDLPPKPNCEVAQPALCFTVVKSAECITGRHLLEATVRSVAKAVGWKGNIARCENLAQLVVEIARLLEKVLGQQVNEEGEELTPAARFVLVFDGIDRQRDAPPTLLPALARLAEIVGWFLH